MAKVVLEFADGEQADLFLTAWKYEPYIAVAPHYIDGAEYSAYPGIITSVTKEE